MEARSDLHSSSTGLASVAHVRLFSHEKIFIIRPEYCVIGFSHTGWPNPKLLRCDMSIWLTLLILVIVAAVISAAVLFGMTWADMRRMRRSR